MIITRTPVRVSFLGGGTDYPDHFLAHGGQTLGVSIDKYSYITVNRHEKLSDYSIRVSYSRQELRQSVDEIEHPSVRECLRYMRLTGGVEIHYMGDLPARTGLGTSSSFTVGLLLALHAFKGEMVSQRRLAEEAVHVEQELIGERVGVQDQYTCALGGLRHLRFGPGGSVQASPVPLPSARLEEFQSHLMLFYTKIRRNAHDVLDEQIDRTRRGAITDDLDGLGRLVDRGLDLLAGGGPIAEFGGLLDAAWGAKRRLSTKVSSDEIDGYYQAARSAGAVGGKLLGAGGGGFLLLLVEPRHQEAVEATLAGLHRVRFGFEDSGSSVLFYQPS